MAFLVAGFPLTRPSAVLGSSGDVGFGKTEVAFRAIYRAVLQQRQAALLAPTSVLAAQHYRNIVKRMPGVRIELLRGGSTNTKEGARIRAAIRNGTAQVVVGTHALLSRSVRFRKLELLVVDEEQRFGVAQKDRLKSLAKGVDVLTLTATPIPRTLQLSLSGLRDLSTLRTPPPGRKDIETHVVKDDDRIVAGAIEREMQRRGQTFYVVPRIEMIAEAVERINRLVPRARVAVAHGRLADVDQIVLGFGDGGYDVLVATSVIESGLDLPMANTIVVMHPQFFGLAALYQLRGRVGRSPRQAYSFFLYPREASITVDALRRLQAIKELSKLGSGFEVATRDMEIRGSGAIVGTEQSGVAANVGPEVFLALLQEAIEEARGDAVTPVTDCALLLPCAAGLFALLPLGFGAGFGAAADVRPAAMAVRSPSEVRRLRERWEAHCELPASVQGLLRAHLLVALGRRLGIAAVSEAISEARAGLDVVLDVPGWTPKVWERLRPAFEETLATGPPPGKRGKPPVPPPGQPQGRRSRVQAVFSNSDKQVRLEALGDNPADAQLEILIHALERLCVIADG